MYSLADLYAEGSVLPKHPAKAVYWMRCAAANGSVLAMLKLAHYYQNGLGILPPDPVQSLVWLREAKNFGIDQEAMDDLEKLEAGLTDEQKRAADKEFQRLQEQGGAPEKPEPD